MEKQIAAAIETLKGGGVIAYPTDTVYGVGADATNQQAVMRIFQIKRRPLSQPFPLLIASREILTYLTSSVSKVAVLLMDRFWPGGLTLVFEKGPNVPLWLTSGGDRIALRVPNHPVALMLLENLNGPLIGTSANLSGHPSTLTAEGVRQQLGDELDLVLDGGVCPGGIASTVVDVTGPAPQILREGAIPRADIENVLS